MCLICAEVMKENIKPKDFWRNLREVSKEHFDEVIDVVTKTSYEYQTELAKAAEEVQDV